MALWLHILLREYVPFPSSRFQKHFSLERQRLVLHQVTLRSLSNSKIDKYQTHAHEEQGSGEDVLQYRHQHDHEVDQPLYVPGDAHLVLKTKGRVNFERERPRKLTYSNQAKGMVVSLNLLILSLKPLMLFMTRLLWDLAMP